MSNKHRCNTRSAMYIPTLREKPSVNEAAIASHQLLLRGRLVAEYVFESGNYWCLVCTNGSRDYCRYSNRSVLYLQQTHGPLAFQSRMIRVAGGFMRKTTAPGIFALLPIGHRVLRKVDVSAVYFLFIQCIAQPNRLHRLLLLAICAARDSSRERNGL